MENMTWWTRVNAAVFIAMFVLFLSAPTVLGAVFVLLGFGIVLLSMWMDNVQADENFERSEDAS